MLGVLPFSAIFWQHPQRLETGIVRVSLAVSRSTFLAPTSFTQSTRLQIDCSGWHCVRSQAFHPAAKRSSGELSGHELALPTKLLGPELTPRSAVDALESTFCKELAFRCLQTRSVLF